MPVQLDLPACAELLEFDVEIHIPAYGNLIPCIPLQIPRMEVTNTDIEQQKRPILLVLDAPWLAMGDGILDVWQDL